MALLSVSPAARTQGYISSAYHNKANFLVRFLDFVEWPEAAFPTPQTPFVMCVRGNFPFGTLLADAARVSLPQGRRVEVRWIHEDQKLQSCHIVFVSQSESKRYTKILRAIEGADVLTVGETPDFLEAGGAMNFEVKADAAGNELLTFEVNLVAANAAHLRVSSKLLAVARRVVSMTEAKKS